MKRRYECRVCDRRYWTKSGWLACLLGHWHEGAGK